ncbi:MAG: hypothetical protein IJB65_05925 [Clostridia bacterium]|nr:hypothetical protein [Clostridia bacterium]
MTYQERIEQLKQEYDIVADEADGTLHTMTIQRKSDGSVYAFTISELYTIARDGAEYDEAIDPLDSRRVYTETANLKAGVEDDEATEADYLAALAKLGVSE